MGLARPQSVPKFNERLCPLGRGRETEQDIQQCPLVSLHTHMRLHPVHTHTYTDIKLERYACWMKKTSNKNFRVEKCPSRRQCWENPSHSLCPFPIVASPENWLVSFMYRNDSNFLISNREKPFPSMSWIRKMQVKVSMPKKTKTSLSYVPRGIECQLNA